MRLTLLNSAKSDHYQLAKTLFFCIFNKGNFALSSPAVKLRKPNKIYIHNIALKQLILQLKTDFRTPDIETVQVLNDSEYLNRVEMLWGDSAEWL